jgi:hypothetical protein
MPTMIPKYAIGTKFIRNARAPREQTVVDIHTTTNSKGEVVKFRYVTEHLFMGRTIIDSDVVETTITRALAN